MLVILNILIDAQHFCSSFICSNTRFKIISIVHLTASTERRKVNTWLITHFKYHVVSAGAYEALIRTHVKRGIRNLGSYPVCWMDHSRIQPS